MNRRRARQTDKTLQFSVDEFESLLFPLLGNCKVLSMLLGRFVEVANCFYVLCQILARFFLIGVRSACFEKEPFRCGASQSEAS